LQIDRLAEQAPERGRQQGQARDERLAQLDGRELRRDAIWHTGAQHEQRRDAADDQGGSETVPHGLAVDRPEPDNPGQRPGPGEDARVGGHRPAPPASFVATGCSPYCARKTSSRFGSRLTTSTIPCCAAIVTTAPIGPLTRIVTTSPRAATS